MGVRRQVLRNSSTRMQVQVGSTLRFPAETLLLRLSRCHVSGYFSCCCLLWPALHHCTCASLMAAGHSGLRTTAASTVPSWKESSTYQTTCPSISKSNLESKPERKDADWQRRHSQLVLRKAPSHQAHKANAPRSMRKYAILMQWHVGLNLARVKTESPLSARMRGIASSA